MRTWTGVPGAWASVSGILHSVLVIARMQRCSQPVRRPRSAPRKTITNLGPLPFGDVTIPLFSGLVMRHAGCEPNTLIMADNWPRATAKRHSGSILFRAGS